MIRSGRIVPTLTTFLESLVMSKPLRSLHLPRQRVLRGAIREPELRRTLFERLFERHQKSIYIKKLYLDRN